MSVANSSDDSFPLFSCSKRDGWMDGWPCYRLRQILLRIIETRHFITDDWTRLELVLIECSSSSSSVGRAASCIWMRKQGPHKSFDGSLCFACVSSQFDHHPRPWEENAARIVSGAKVFPIGGGKRRREWHDKWFLKHDTIALESSFAYRPSIHSLTQKNFLHMPPALTAFQSLHLMYKWRNLHRGKDNA